MDRKKLMHILLRDMHELEELVIEMQHNGTCDPFDLELLRTRISGIKHLLEVAGDIGERPGDSIPVPQKPKPEPPPQQEKDLSSVETPAINVISGKESFMTKPVAVPPALETDNTGKILPESAEETPLKDDHLIPQDIELEEEKDHQEKQTLGEKFVAGKSVYDLLVKDKAKSNTIHSHIPVTSLSNSVGTNDRFLFTRELFDGDMDLFNETIRKIDVMNTIQEAAAYLRENYKWKKSETSLKFIELVKRRFL